MLRSGRFPLRWLHPLALLPPQRLAPTPHPRLAPSFRPFASRRLTNSTPALDMTAGIRAAPPATLHSLVVVCVVYGICTRAALSEGRRCAWGRVGWRCAHGNGRRPALPVERSKACYWDGTLTYAVTLRQVCGATHNVGARARQREESERQNTVLDTMSVARLPSRPPRRPGIALNVDTFPALSEPRAQRQPLTPNPPSTPNP